MIRKRSIVRAGAVLALAVAAGHLVQTMRADAPQQTAMQKPENIVKTAAGITPPLTAGMVPALAATDLTLAALTDTPPAGGAASLAPASDPAARITADVPARLPADTVADCAPRLTLAAGPRAMIAADLTAACAAGARVVLRHGGLVVAESLDAKGQLHLDIPALDAAGEVSVLLPDAQIAQARVAVPGMDKIHRFAVQWMGDDTLQLSAYEDGARYGADHVSAEQPVSAKGGYLVALGDPGLDLPMMAQVYTWPATGTATPVIEAAVTELTCDRELRGQALLSAAGKMTTSDLSLSMPDCASLGDILVLNNPVPEMTLAANN